MKRLLDSCMADQEYLRIDVVDCYDQSNRLNSNEGNHIKQAKRRIFTASARSNGSEYPQVSEQARKIAQFGSQLHQQLNQNSSKAQQNSKYMSFSSDEHRQQQQSKHVLKRLNVVDKVVSRRPISSKDIEGDSCTSFKSGDRCISLESYSRVLRLYKGSPQSPSSQGLAQAQIIQVNGGKSNLEAYDGNKINSQFNSLTRKGKCLTPKQQIVIDSAAPLTSPGQKIGSHFLFSSTNESVNISKKISDMKVSSPVNSIENERIDKSDHSNLNNEATGSSGKRRVVVLKQSLVPLVLGNDYSSQLSNSQINLKSSSNSQQVKFEVLSENKQNLIRSGDLPLVGGGERERDGGVHQPMKISRAFRESYLKSQSIQISNAIEELGNHILTSQSPLLNQIPKQTLSLLPSIFSNGSGVGVGTTAEGTGSIAAADSKDQDSLQSQSRMESNNGSQHLFIHDSLNERQNLFKFSTSFIKHAKSTPKKNMFKP